MYIRPRFSALESNHWFREQLSIHSYTTSRYTNMVAQKCRHPGCVRWAQTGYDYCSEHQGSHQVTDSINSCLPLDPNKVFLGHTDAKQEATVDFHIVHDLGY
ncbi:hypothetical protein OE88DRAFT_1560430 [Heliocybe sulcata]|uniref:Uncharacterized protein n=1 Tax=Heliocybe sulcata TaxID=5364 RepID=A0A5C3N506_9AGAM|nr:hypothetical protein OE88DRAFT_1560430 [Heliocybe sulcata]